MRELILSMKLFVLKPFLSVHLWYATIAPWVAEYALYALLRNWMHAMTAPLVLDLRVHYSCPWWTWHSPLWSIIAGSLIVSINSSLSFDLVCWFVIFNARSKLDWAQGCLLWSNIWSSWKFSSWVLPWKDFALVRTYIVSLKVLCSFLPLNELLRDYVFL